MLTKVPIGTSGYGVNIGGTFVIVKPDLDSTGSARRPGQAADPTAGLPRSTAR